MTLPGWDVLPSHPNRPGGQQLDGRHSETRRFRRPARRRRLLAAITETLNAVVCRSVLVALEPLPIGAYLAGSLGGTAGVIGWALGQVSMRLMMRELLPWR